ncbi:hypothetical protein CBLAS_0932 [Campylobacter blaseri]|uniref:Uncharacterized protein n=1 Tax=Campylobacter blaseri TaxID=2042961 RepID=A0A2P8QYN6_9BACT|nr:hypothetical protein [Campylobacter blaseri]PSM51366.1 hypothetical protein CQ405_08225 [Campylobacter blaseri]PSM52816.1 hypothetical protein CRN67_08230 [Campylobacter blaseri]QKF86117.1 hypothetical protein CBLAS_0932 [Campylobacter blaseri]
MGFVRLSKDDIKNFVNELTRLEGKKSELNKSKKDIKKKEHLDERIEAIKRVLAGKDDEYDAFLDIVYTLIWDEGAISTLASEYKELKTYAKGALKNEFEKRREVYHLYYLAKNSIEMPEGYYDV